MLHHKLETSPDSGALILMIAWISLNFGWSLSPTSCSSTASLVVTVAPIWRKRWNHQNHVKKKEKHDETVIRRWCSPKVESCLFEANIVIQEKGALGWKWARRKWMPAQASFWPSMTQHDPAEYLGGWLMLR